MTTIPTRPSLLTRLLRAVRVRRLLHQANAIKAERQQYERAGRVGPIYQFNSITAELDKRMAARRLELGQ